MSTSNVVFKLATNMAQKLTKTTTKLDNGGDTLVLNPNIRGEVMALIVSWSAFHRSGQELEAQANGGHSTGTSKDENVDLFMQFVLNHGVALLIELTEATNTLELWPLFELCCRTLANVTGTKRVQEVYEYLDLKDADGTKISKPVIEGFLKYLSLEKILELVAIQLEERPHMEYIKGTLNKELKGKNFPIRPTSKNTPCYHELYEEDIVRMANSANHDVVYNAVEYYDWPLIRSELAIINHVASIEVKRHQAKRVGQFWYLIAKCWFDRMTNYPSIRPGKVDNRPLLNICDGEYELKDGLEENTDYVLVPEDTWQLIVSNFGLIDENQTVERSVVDQLFYSNHFTHEVEVYGVTLHLASFKNPKVHVKKTLSRTVPHSQLMQEMKNIFEIDDNCQTRLWVNITLVDDDYYPMSMDTMDCSGVYVRWYGEPREYLPDKCNLSIEVRKFNGYWPSEC